MSSKGGQGHPRKNNMFSWEFLNTKYDSNDPKVEENIDNIDTKIISPLKVTQINIL